MHERRSAPRQRKLFGGKIVFNSGRSAIDCTVRNLSDHGACLQVQSPVGIPNHFYVLLAGHEDLRGCKVAWRAADRMGVLFEQTIVGTSDAADVFEPGRQAEAGVETAAFRAALDQVQFGVVSRHDRRISPIIFE